MDSLLNWFAEPWRYEFLTRALVAAILVGGICAALGTYVVLRGMAFLGDALAHAILPGVVISFLLGWPLIVGALIVGVATALAIGAMSNRGMLREDTAIGVLFAGSLALGVALLSLTGSYAVDLSHFLFGNLLGVTSADLIWIVVLGGGVLLVLILFYKEFLIVSFDLVLASTLRMSGGFFRYLLLVLMAITIVVSLKVAGVALVVAMFVTPAAAAQLLARRVWRIMIIAGVIGSFSGLLGLYLSYYGGISSGPAVVLVATAIFLLAFLFAPRRGVIWTAVARRQLRGAA